MEKEAIKKPFLRKHTGAPNKQLPEDVIEDILSRLAVKPLLRFRSVCKRWYSLISSSRRFASMHLKRSLSNPTMHSIIHIREYTDKGRFPLVYLNPTNLAPLTSSHLDPFHPVVNPIDPRKAARVFVGSVNGLVCLRSLPGRETNGYETDWLGIWNPSTKTVRELTIPATNPDFYAVAFGWDPTSNDHKVMRLCRTRSGSGGWVEVWSVQGSSCWRSFQINGLGDVLPICTQSLIMGDGRTFCLVSRGRQARYGNIIRYRDLVACFDMVKEEIRFISLPVETNNCDGDLVALVNWKGDLALSTLIEKPGINTPPSFQIWKAAADIVGGWTKSFIIDLSSDVPPSVYNPATSITPTQILIFGFGQLFLYDLETKQYQTVQTPDYTCLQACHHVESLF